MGAVFDGGSYWVISGLVAFLVKLGTQYFSLSTVLLLLVIELLVVLWLFWLN